MSKRDVSLLLKDITDSIEKIERYTCMMDFESFAQDDKTVDAVVRNFEIIGEILKSLAKLRVDCLKFFVNSIHKLPGVESRIFVIS